MQVVRAEFLRVRNLKRRPDHGDISMLKGQMIY